MGRYDKDIEDLHVRRERILDGKLNCLPLPFPRMRNYFPGVEKRRYQIITANQKVGKSKFTDKLMVYDPFFYAIEHPDQVRVSILYFTLEMGKKEKFYEFLCHLLWKLDRIRVSPTELKSTSADKPISQEVLDLIGSDKYQYYIKKFEETVEYVDTVKHPTGIYYYCKAFAERKGEWKYKDGKVKSGDSFVDGKVKDYFEQNDPEEYLIVVLDNYSNLSTESGMNKMQTIDKMSKYAIELRDQYNFNFTAIQHQAQAQEGLENRKMNQLEPSPDGLADCKTTIRDANCAFGLFSPFKYGIKQYPDGPIGYDITKFRNHIRFVKVMENRDGEAGCTAALFFDGAISEFIELPLPTNTAELEIFYQQVQKLHPELTKI